MLIRDSLSRLVMMNYVEPLTRVSLIAVIALPPRQEAFSEREN